MNIKPERLIADLRELATIGKFETGVHRPAFTHDDTRAREWVRDKMIAAGLTAQIDDAANVYGRMPGVERAVLVGSHTDSVPRGGWLDGSLGVVYGLEIARCFVESSRANGIGIDVVSFQDEEGTYLAEYGCRTFCGEDVRKEAAMAKNQEGQTLEAAIQSAGIRGNPPARLDRDRHLAYFEAHIEQGPRLEAENKKIGVVKGIVGIRTYRILFKGQADHAGTTPMRMRRDAAAAALQFGATIDTRFRKAGSPDSVWNIGNAVFKPGAANVVPSEVQLALQFRDPSLEVLDKFEELTHKVLAKAALASGVKHEITRLLAIKPTDMDRGLAETIAAAAVEADAPHVVMPSGAGHDAMIMARHLPSAMLFIPSIGGRSHHISEDTAEEDIVIGARVMLKAVSRFVDRRTASA